MEKNGRLDGVLADASCNPVESNYRHVDGSLASESTGALQEDARGPLVDWSVRVVEARSHWPGSPAPAAAAAAAVSQYSIAPRTSSGKVSTDWMRAGGGMCGKALWEPLARLARPHCG
ncbi:hypothetical protein TOPH_00189 [Tolypocladium ophioglossoides CBS 100239]|uniref:Uncharacterized protein n=1 Tax=Tolypocladium ophioglossoides (strain CBS 100239) TaxID=1163406 RepID=A0A0L0NNV1_TOLOC|nr:hypothetical protein TOPH_00189 [Tolypocladium ophioglossoides CBS 100239]